jgi:hypothetical protein
MSFDTRKLPDVEICQIKEMGISNFDQCLIDNPVACFYALPFGNAHFCRFPQRKELFQQGNVNLIRTFAAAKHE